MIFRTIRAAVLSAAASIAIIAAFATLSGLMLTPERAFSVALRAFAQTALLWNDRRNEDLFTECAMLQMQLLRPKGAWQQAIDTRFRMDADVHPCATLVRTVMRIDLETMPPVQSYFNYPYGSRHIEAAVLSVLHYPNAVVVYGAFSYGSLALLLIVMLWRDRRTGVLLAPIPIVLMLGFSLHLFGSNLAHAPGYILGWLELAAFVALRPWLEPFPRRVAFFVAIGFLAAYTDLLSGVTPTLLAMTIVLNHFFYVRVRSEGYVARTVVNMAAVLVCFLAAFLLLNGIRLWALSLSGLPVFEGFLKNLVSKGTSDIGLGAPLTYWTVLDRLWDVRHQMAPGGEPVATLVLMVGALSWAISALAVFVRTSMQTRMDVLVLAATSLGFFLWYAMLPGHAYVHALFMVRLLALPCAFGIVAALVLSIRRGHRPLAELARAPAG